MFDPFEKSISEIAAALAAGETSSLELVDYYLDRIERFDRAGPELNSILTINPNARGEAEMLDANRNSGEPKGLLYGLPILVKDNANTADMPTTCGCKALSDFRPKSDAFVISRLKEAGAIILAKTTLSEFTKHGLSCGSLFGQTKNPYDLTRTPGGSSGGSGVGVSANFGVAGIGTDTMNSVRSPSSACCIVGMRPTTGLWSRSGFVPIAELQDTAGPMARSVADISILLEACQGYDGADPISAQQVGYAASSYRGHLKKDGLNGRHIGMLFTNFGNDEDVMVAMEDSMRVMRDMGATVVYIDAPEFKSSGIYKSYDVQSYESEALLDRYFAENEAPVSSLKELLNLGVVEKYVKPLLEQCVSIENPLEHPEYIMRKFITQKLRERVYAVMAENNLDVMCYPHQQILVEKIGTGTQAGRNGILASVIGFPAITLPGGFSRPGADAPLGVPIGIEFMGRPWNEPLLIEIAYSFEQATLFRKSPLSTPGL